ncbi:stage III sporulation protein SpoAB [Sporolactobacillus shoreae]|uniref:Stage III sporulation protein SpoAB n=1 Tax=Sporolactobacillus shoreae TaxID=1465501 RepID=A0A4Z0GHX2_9BACL|nr:stage III sporulation protein SpoIIIAB [Sporolactobacillus shoreae]TGA96396.1 stage III sporulation protein SpoAB [Sporolactobacillus shoreae]
MIQLLGSLLIVVSSTSAGIVIARGFRDRPKEIRQWRSALQSIEAEIVYGRIPVDDMAGHLSVQLPHPIAFFFQILQKKMVSEKMPLREAWPDAIKVFWPETSMRKAEKEVILQFGSTLGTEDAENQQKHIQLALAHLEREEEEARARQEANEKMTRSLGFLAGILIVLICI